MTKREFIKLFDKIPDDAEVYKTAFDPVIGDIEIEADVRYNEYSNKVFIY